MVAAAGEMPSLLLRRVEAGAVAGLPSIRSFCDCRSPSPCSRPPDLPVSDLIASSLGGRRGPSRAVALSRRGASWRSLGRQGRTGLFSAVIHQLVGDGRYAQAICLTKELIQELRGAGTGDPGRHIGRDAYDTLRRFQGPKIDFRTGRAAFDVLIVALSQGGLVEEALWVFQHLGDPPSINACNALLTGLLRAGRLGCLWGLYAEMVGRGRQPSGVTYNILLNACRWQGDLSRALRLLDEMISKGFDPSVVTYTTVVCGLCEEGRLREALGLLGRMVRSRVPPNLYTYNVLMEGHCRRADVRGALALYGGMLRRGLLPNVVTFGTLVNGLCKEGRTREARTLFRGMVRHHRVAPNAQVYNCLIEGLCKSGELSEAFELRSEMARAGVRPDAVTCGILMKGLCEAGRPREALELLQKMRREGDVARASPVLYNTLIDGHCKQGNVEEGTRIWSQMAEEGVEPNAITFSLLIDAHCKKGEMETATAIFSEMVVRGRTPDVVTYTSLIDGHMKKGSLAEVGRLNREMAEAGVPANAFTLSALVDGLCRQGRSREAMHLLLKSIGVDPGAGRAANSSLASLGACLPCAPNAVAYMTLIRGLHADAQDFKAGRLFLLMREAGMVPDAPTYAVLLKGQCRSGRRMNAMALLADMLKAGVTPEEEENPAGISIWGERPGESKVRPATATAHSEEPRPRSSSSASASEQPAHKRWQPGAHYWLSLEAQLDRDVIQSKAPARRGWTRRVGKDPGTNRSQIGKRTQVNASLAFRRGSRRRRVQDRLLGAGATASDGLLVH